MLISLIVGSIFLYLENFSIDKFLSSHGSLKQMSFNYFCIIILFVLILLKYTFMQNVVELLACQTSSFKPSSPCRATLRLIEINLHFTIIEQMHK